MRTRIIAFVPALAFCAFASIGLKPLDSFTIKRKPKVGATVKYTSIIEYEVNGGLGNMTASIAEKVVNVDKDGNFTVEQSQLSVEGTYNKEKINTPDRAPVRITYKPSGVATLIKIATDTPKNGDLIDGNDYRMENLGAIIDPGKPLNVDDVWLSDIKGDKTLGTVDAKAEYKLLGEEMVGKVDTLKIKGTVKEIPGDHPASNEFTEWISKDDGSLVQLDAKWTNAPFSGVSYPVTASIKLQRVGD